MLKVRVIPTLFLMNGLIVRSEGFETFQVIGNPYSELERYSQWLADELVYVDITREGGHDLRRDDHKVKDEGNDILAILETIAKHAFMPLTFGGRIASIDQVDAFVRTGADKVVITSQAWREPELITRVAEKYGSQAMVVGLDVKRHQDGRLRAFVDQGRTAIDAEPEAWAREAERRGAGEIFLNSVDRDGGGEGFDLDAVRRVVEAVSIPVIACGGVGTFEHFAPAVTEAGASAVAAGNIFHFTENAYKRAKRTLQRRGIDVRYPYPS